MATDHSFHAAAFTRGSPATLLHAQGLERHSIHRGNRVPIVARQAIAKQSAERGSQLPKDFPPFTTVQYYFYKLRDSGLLDIMNEALVAASRLSDGREAQPTAGIIDSQSVKSTESGGPCGYDAGKKTMGRKRHIVTDTQGNLLCLIVQTADIQDRDGGADVIAQACARIPDLACIFADGGYAGEGFADTVTAFDGPKTEVVRRPKGVSGFVVIARRWVVERTFAWMGRCRRLAKDWEASIASSEAWTLIAAISRTTRHLARKSKAGS